MIKSPKEAEFSLKQEGKHHHQSITISDHDQKAKASASSSTSTVAQWPRLKDPRIVRVSRAFGGKDRHSKVCTIRGLRDRRVRLSVPTAIQLYDLQDRLGLNQPSKVVDWLLNAAKDEIDELPPLPNIPPINTFTLNPPSLANQVTTSTLPNSEFININNQNNSVWKLSSKAKEVSSGEIMVSEEDKLPAIRNQNHQNNASFLGLLNTMPFGYQWEQNSSEHVSQFNNQTDSVHGNNSINVVPFTSNLSLSTGNNNSHHHQILVCPPPHAHGVATHSYFPSHVGVMDMDHQRQISHHYQMMSSGSQNLLTNSLNPSFGLAMMTPKPLHSANSSESQSQKDQDFPSK